MEMEGPNYFDVIEHAKESKRRQDIFKWYYGPIAQRIE
jgi:hypothetical protein